MDKLADTMELIKCCKNESKEPIFFCEMSMYEMLKNKNDVQRFRTFKSLDYFVKQSHSEMLVSDQSINVFDDRDEVQRYTDALKVCKKCAYTVANSFLHLCAMILQLLLLQKGNSSLQEKDVTSYEKTMAVIVKVVEMLSNEMKDELIDCAFNNNSELLEEELYKKVLNIFIDKINKNLGIDYLKLHDIVSFTTNGIAKENNIKFDKRLIDKYIDEVVSFKSNEDITKKVYKVYLEDLLLVSGKIHFNDIVDMNIFFAGYSNKLRVVSTDKKPNRLLTMLITNC